MIEKEIKLTNPNDLQTRTGALFVQTAEKFSADVWITKNEKRINGKSIMGILSLDTSEDITITISAEGEDEIQAVEELTSLIEYDNNE